MYVAARGAQKPFEIVVGLHQDHGVAIEASRDASHEVGVGVKPARMHKQTWAHPAAGGETANSKVHLFARNPNIR